MVIDEKHKTDSSFAVNGLSAIRVRSAVATTSYLTRAFLQDDIIHF